MGRSKTRPKNRTSFMEGSKNFQKTRCEEIEQVGLNKKCSRIKQEL